ncbi:hypothetical protein P4197_03625 [Pseudomonas aeruginosa]|nr:hypothetical protein [Pseudomonas aeruginosa]
MSSGKHDPVDPAKRMSAGEQYRAAFEAAKKQQARTTAEGDARKPEQRCQRGWQRSLCAEEKSLSLLIAEIQKYVEAHAEQRPPSVRQVSLLARRKNRGLRERIEEITQQRDHLASLLSEADATILELYDRIAELERQLPASNVVSLEPRGPKNSE